MKAPVGLEDIEEFEFIYRIPRAAITEEILEGVRQLHEPNEIEPFLRDILIDRTETPHTSTEISDILTTHVTYLGQPCLTAFVNKGKSYPKVIAKEVTHQLYRLRQIRSLGLIVLLAVGDIYDDAKRDFLQIVEDANVDYMIVDAIDVARLFIVYHKICPKDGTPFLKGKCRKCGTPANDPIELTLKVHEELRYDILSINDLSHRQLKQYKAEIWAPPHYSRAALRQVIQKVTSELRHRKFSRSEQLEQHFGERDADCVFLFVYLDLQDRQQHNWRCQASWIRADLPEESKSLRLEGNDRIAEIEISWNPNYYHRRDSQFQHLAKKEDWVQKVEEVLWQLEELVQQAKRLLKEHRKGKLGEPEFQTKLGQLESESMNLWQEAQEAARQKFPPLDCHECNFFFQSMICSFHNIFIRLGSCRQEGGNWKQQLWLMQEYLERYQDKQDRFQHEWRKIGRQ